MNPKKSKRFHKRILLLTAALIFTPLVCILAYGSIVAVRYWQEFLAPPGARMINAYFRAKGITAIPGSNEYSSRMKGIVMGGHPELTAENSKFAPTEAERRQVDSFAIRHITKGRWRNLFRLFPEPDPVEPDVPEALEPDLDLNKMNVPYP